MAHLTPKRWFLPNTPDVIGMLREQLAVTIEGVDAFTNWAEGASCAASDVREIEARGDVARRDLLDALREAFITPMEPEDLFMLSSGIDRILNGVGDLIAEAEVLKGGPDEDIAVMAKLLADAVREIDSAVEQMTSAPERATEAADRAIEVIHELETHYYSGMAGTINLDVRGERIARREIYRRCARLADTAVDVAERVIYAMVKET